MISEWESRGLSNEKFRPPYTTYRILSPKLKWNKYKIRLWFEGRCLKQEDTTPITPSNIVNLFIVYELDSWASDLNTNFTLSGCLFGGVKLTKTADPDKVMVLDSLPVDIILYLVVA